MAPSPERRPKLCPAGHTKTPNRRGHLICLICRNKVTKAWRERNIDRIRMHNRARQARYRKENKDHVRKRAKANYTRDKLRTLSHYSGGGTPHCACCGETHVEFLSIDHVDGGGTRHRKSLKMKGGYRFCIWLRQQGYPGGYRVLCHNCNQSIGHYGYCPHQREPTRAATDRSRICDGPDSM